MPSKLTLYFYCAMPKSDIDICVDDIGGMGTIATTKDTVAADEYQCSRPGFWLQAITNVQSSLYLYLISLNASLVI